MNLLLRLLAPLMLATGLGACAHTAPPPTQQAARTILFIGNSFTMGANAAALRYRTDTVDDLNGEGVGGVPAIFARFAEQAGVRWRVAHETRGGTTLGFHHHERRVAIDRPWDVVVMQQFSVLDPDKPGDRASTMRDAPELARLFTAANPEVEVYLAATWTRADQAYTPQGHWFGQPVEAMARDVQDAIEAAEAASPEIDGILPIGAAWSRAMASGIADPNPYDGRAYGQIDLWSYDHYHASDEGYYLFALVAFARVTGFDPRRFGAQEKAAHELGIAPDTARRLQEVAAETLGMEEQGPR